MKHGRTSRTLLLSAAVMIGGLGVACSDDGDDAADTDGSTPSSDTTSAEAPAEPADGDQTVSIADYAFDPEVLTIKVGSKVTWTNSDDFEHTATSDDGTPAAFDTAELATDGSGEYTFDQVGTYTYKCAIHTYMEGTVDVVE
jgi:plastocyanin